MRIADSTRLESILRDTASLQRQLLDASKQASSGSRLSSPSSDPVGAAQLVRIQASLDQAEGFRSVMRTARGDLELAESSLDSAHGLVDRMHEIALQAANGALTAQDRSTLSAEVRQLKQELVGIANQKGSIGYLFAGTLDQQAPFAADGTFHGNALDRVAQVGPGQSMVVGANGALGFTALGGRNVFTDVDALATALDTNDQAACSQCVYNLDASGRQILAARADAGTKLARMDTAEEAHAQAVLTLSAQRHAVADVDPAEAFTRLSALENGLQLSISVARSLLDTMSVRWL